MKTILAILVFAVTTANATLYTFNYSDLNMAIPDGDAGGISDSHVISGINNSITDVSVTLNVSGGFSGDLYGYLVSDSGFAVLLNRVGRTSTDPYGSSASGFSITLSESAASDIHLASGTFGSPIVGNWQSDGRISDPNSVLDTDTRQATLNSFIGNSANGTWTLFLSDTSPIGESMLSGWSLQISTVPEPVTIALAGFLLAVLGIRFRRQLAYAVVRK